MDSGFWTFHVSLGIRCAKVDSRAREYLVNQRISVCLASTTASAGERSLGSRPFISVLSNFL